jgi:Na+/melibiose symporter-like transporter
MSRDRLMDDSGTEYHDLDLGKPASRATYEGPSVNVLNKTAVMAYSVGHVCNDLCGAIWGTFFLIFLTSDKLGGLSQSEAGVVFLVGQVADGLFTPLVGVVSDNTMGVPACRLGRRKFWFLVGAVIVMVNCFLMFGECIACDEGAGELGRLAYFSILSVFANIGWAASYVTHSALVSELTDVQEEQALLNDRRSAFTNLSSILIFLSYLLCVNIGVNERDTFLVLALMQFCIGGVTVIFFMLGVSQEYIRDFRFQRRVNRDERLHFDPRKPNEVVHSVLHGDEGEEPEIHDGPAKTGVSASISYWFRLSHFYIVALGFTSARVTMTLLSTYLLFYFRVTLGQGEHANSDALAPLVFGIASVGGNYLRERITNRFSSLALFGIGGLICVPGWLVYLFIHKAQLPLGYVATIFLGAGSSITQASAFTVRSNLCGDRSDSAFVVGVLGFGEKIATGIVVFVLQLQVHTLSEHGQSIFYRHAMVTLAAVFVVIAYALFATVRNISAKTANTGGGGGH